MRKMMVMMMSSWLLLLGLVVTPHSAAPGPSPPGKGRKLTSESEEVAAGVVQPTLLHPLMEKPCGPAHSASLTNPLPDVSDMASSLSERLFRLSEDLASLSEGLSNLVLGALDTLISSPSLPSPGAPSVGSSSLMSPPGPGAPRQSSVDGVSSLCAVSDADGLTALNNGTILLFKGEWLWSVDPVSRSVGARLNIKSTLGVPSPIDAVFTHLGHTYIIKRELYWRLDRLLKVDKTSPTLLSAGFSGLTGQVTAALLLPASRDTPETVFFFKKGGVVQKFSFPPDSDSSCRPKALTSRRRCSPQAAGRLGPEVRWSLGSLRSVSAALSLATPPWNPRSAFYVFSGPLFFSVKVVGDILVLVDPESSVAMKPPINLSAVAMVTNNSPAPSHAHPPNSLQSWLRCP